MAMWLNVAILLTLFSSRCTAEQQVLRHPKQVAAFKFSGSWSGGDTSTTSSSFMAVEVITAMCKNAAGKDEKEKGGEETDKSEESSTDTDNGPKSANNNLCFSCFANINSSPYQIATAMKSELENCSQMYLTEGPFRNCVDELTKLNSSGDATDVTNLRPTPQRKTRDFSECVYTQLKREMVQTCVEEVAMATSDTVDKIQQFFNTTSCILAKFRCANFSVSTGASRMLGQHQTVAALAIANTGDLHIIRVPDIAYGPGMTQTKFSPADWQGAQC